MGARFLLPTKRDAPVHTYYQTRLGLQRRKVSKCLYNDFQYVVYAGAKNECMILSIEMAKTTTYCHK